MILSSMSLSIPRLPMNRRVSSFPRAVTVDDGIEGQHQGQTGESDRPVLTHQQIGRFGRLPYQVPPSDVLDCKDHAN